MQWYMCENMKRQKITIILPHLASARANKGVSSSASVAATWISVKSDGILHGICFFFGSEIHQVVVV